jgi:hypothetical protein
MQLPAGVAQLVEHFSRKEGVPGSSPGVGFLSEPNTLPFRVAFRGSVRWKKWKRLHALGFSMGGKDMNLHAEPKQALRAD